MRVYVCVYVCVHALSCLNVCFCDEDKIFKKEAFSIYELILYFVFFASVYNFLWSRKHHHALG